MIEKYRKYISVVLLLLSIYAPMHWLTERERNLWLLAIVLTMGLAWFRWPSLKEKNHSVEISCAPTATNFHTFKTKEQWSCDCGEVRRGSYKTPDGTP